MGIGRSINGEWFKSNVGCCVGDGNNIGFRKFKWLGNNSFSELYLDLFAKEVYQDVLISEKLEGDTTEWLWQWREEFSNSDEQQLSDLKELLVGIHLDSAIPDKCQWAPGA
ncbi:putative ribonuclease H protein, partial [Trifolium medium]|nr:putative ribonuclease H protein [Trifolium medium]